MNGLARKQTHLSFFKGSEPLGVTSAARIRQVALPGLQKDTAPQSTIFGAVLPVDSARETDDRLGITSAAAARVNAARRGRNGHRFSLPQAVERQWADELSQVPLSNNRWWLF